MNRRAFIQSALAMTAGGLLVPEYLLTRGRSMVTVGWDLAGDQEEVVIGTYTHVFPEDGSYKYEFGRWARVV